MTSFEYFIGLLASFLANFFSALSGGGSGLFLLPALLFLGMPFPIALASHKITTIGLGLGASSRHFRQPLKSNIIIFSILTGGPGVLLGASIVEFIPEKVAKLVLGSLIIYLGLVSKFKVFTFNSKAPDISKTKAIFIGGLGFFIIGFLNGSFTSGTGLLFTYWLVFWYSMSFLVALSYTMIVCSLIYNSVGALVLGLSIEVEWSLIFVMIIGAVSGGYMGASLSLTKGEKFIKSFFSLSCFVIGLLLLLSSLID